MTLWQCVLSAATTWATTSHTGSKWARRFLTHRRYPRQLVQKPTTRATSSGRASAHNLRVLEWILKRCEDKVDAVEVPFGLVPKPEDINIEGLKDVTLDTIKELLRVDTESWIADIDNIRDFYNTIDSVGHRMPKELWEELDNLEKALKK